MEQNHPQNSFKREERREKWKRMKGKSGGGKVESVGLSVFSGGRRKGEKKKVEMKEENFKRSSFCQVEFSSLGCEKRET